MHMNVSSRATTATWSSRMKKAPRIPCGANPARDVPPAARPMPARPPGGMLNAYWICACADITLNLRRVQISPSICMVADDEDDRNHLSSLHELLQLPNAELLQEIIRETPPRTPRCVSRKSPRPIDGDLCSRSGCDARACGRLRWRCSKSPRKTAAAVRLRSSIHSLVKRAQEPCCCAPAWVGVEIRLLHDWNIKGLKVTAP